MLFAANFAIALDGKQLMSRFLILRGRCLAMSPGGDLGGESNGRRVAD